MPITSKTYHSNAIVGIPQVGADVNIYEVHANPKFAVGTRFQRQDGCDFTYCHFGATSAQGRLVSHEGNESDLLIAAACTAPLAAQQRGKDPVGVYPNGKGSLYALITAAGASSNLFAGGYLIVGAGSGNGYTYRIRSNDAVSTTVSGQVLIELYDQIQESIGANTYVSIVGSKYANLGKASTGTQAGIIVGVTCANVSTANYYGWVQTKGICGVMAGATMVTGQWATQSTTGTVGVYAATGTDVATAVAAFIASPIIGCVARAAGATSHAGIVLNLG